MHDSFIEGLKIPLENLSSCSALAVGDAGSEAAASSPTLWLTHCSSKAAAGADRFC